MLRLEGANEPNATASFAMLLPKSTRAIEAVVVVSKFA
jgi:hypothetical protein